MQRRGVHHALPGRLRARRAFTLIELLVVVVIIALLIAILVPTLHRAREHAYDAICKSNLKQLWETLQAGDDLAVPQAHGWIAFVRDSGAQAVLKCPKHALQGEGGRMIIVKSNVVEISPPPSSRFNEDPESNTTIFAFTERESYVLPAAVRVNISAPGHYDSTGDLTPKTIPAGTMVDCQYLFYDPVGSTETTSSGAITMAGDILGVICLDAELNASDDVLGRPGTAYHTGEPARGYEMGAEIVSLEPDGRTFTIHRYHSSYPGENIRILTVPGGSASYGMNNQIRQHGPRVNQLLLLDYNKTVVDVDGEGYNDDFGQCLAPRHLGKANAVFISGNVRGLRPAELAPADNEGIWRP